ncbi:hypothetical protein D5R81_17345 [Parashewanella spongiae]|uniref:Uncharacterized protein n=1 Tax=Parashewanella spongiae TaxID=342950 RepID=A0A3A6TP81_9GAMM|nr:ankyrin repeat domain-containing protein [Parashewanella spongiae]MCL1077621.1 ankyrin repeat domain-containing protein [Parashewanella spongiae]RJY06784.1 hypothetical protein D5R81_17345 [Parashewanella spongiae]
MALETVDRGDLKVHLEDIELKDIVTQNIVQQTLCPEADALVKIAKDKWPNNENVKERLITFAENCCEVGEHHFETSKEILYSTHQVQLKELTDFLNDRTKPNYLKEKIILKLPSSKEDFDFKLCGISKALRTLHIDEGSKEFVDEVTQKAVVRGFGLYVEYTGDTTPEETDYNQIATKLGIKLGATERGEPEGNQRTRFVLSRMSEHYLCLRLARELIQMLSINSEDEVALKQLTLLTGNADYKTHLLSADKHQHGRHAQIPQLAQYIFAHTTRAKLSEPIIVGTFNIIGNPARYNIETSNFQHFDVVSESGKRTEITLKEYQACNSAMHPHIKDALLRNAALNTKSLINCVEFARQNELFVPSVSRDETNKIEMKKECLNRISELATSTALDEWLSTLTERDCQTLRSVEKLIDVSELKAKCFVRLSELKGLWTDDNSMLSPAVLVHMPSEILQTALSDKMKQTLLCQHCYLKKTQVRASSISIELVKKLLELDFDHNCKDSGQYHPILIVCSGGNLDMLKVLYEYSNDNFEKNPWSGTGYNGANFAALKGHVDILKYIFSRRAGPVITQENMNGQTVMYFAVQCTNTACMEYLLSQPSLDVNGLDTPSQYFLNYIEHNGTKEAMLVALKADHWKNHFAFRAYSQKYMRANSDNTVAVKRKTYAQLTLKEVTELSLYDKRKCLVEYCRTGNTEGVKVLLNTGMSAEFFISDTLKQTPLVLAASLGHLDVVKELNSQSTDSEDNREWAIFLACVEGHHEVVKHLASFYDSEGIKGVISSVRALDGMGLPHIVANEGHVETMKVLVQRDPSLLSRAVKFKPDIDRGKGNLALEGDTPLIVASRAGHVEMVEYLMAFTDYGSSFKNCENGQNALHAAVRANKPEVVQALFDIMPDEYIKAVESIKGGQSIFDYVRVNQKSAGLKGSLEFYKQDYSEMRAVFDKRRQVELTEFSKTFKEKQEAAGVHGDGESFEFL